MKMSELETLIFDALKEMPGANRYELANRIGTVSAGSVEDALFCLKSDGLIRSQSSPCGMYQNWYFESHTHEKMEALKVLSKNQFDLTASKLSEAGIDILDMTPEQAYQANEIGEAVRLSLSVPCEMVVEADTATTEKSAVSLKNRVDVRVDNTRRTKEMARVKWVYFTAGVCDTGLDGKKCKPFLNFWEQPNKDIAIFDTGKMKMGHNHSVVCSGRAKSYEEAKVLLTERWKEQLSRYPTAPAYREIPAPVAL